MATDAYLAQAEGGASDDDWHDIQAPSEFGKLLGPLRRRRVGGGWHYGLSVRPEHRNEAGAMHGGAMTALIDEVIGTMVNEAVGRKHATVQFATVFLKPVQVGDFVEASCKIVEVTRSMTFVEATLAVGNAAVATATLIFKARRSAP
jgi:acyl-coenzyme A thioesterase 13